MIIQSNKIVVLHFNTISPLHLCKLGLTTLQGLMKKYKMNYDLNSISFHLGKFDRKFNFYKGKRIRAIKECFFLWRRNHFNFRSIKHDYCIPFGPISFWQIAFLEVAINEIDCKKNEQQLPLFVFRHSW